MSPSDNVLKAGEELGARAIRGSVTERADLKRLLGACGRVDALVNSTGRPPGSIDPTGPGFQP